VLENEFLNPLNIQYTNLHSLNFLEHRHNTFSYYFKDQVLVLCSYGTSPGGRQTAALTTCLPVGRQGYVTSRFSSINLIHWISNLANYSIIKELTKRLYMNS
jgi:hypothetical protein